MASMIQLTNVNKIYGETVKTQVLFDVSLDIEAGSFVSIIGQSGSGKSTLLNIIGTLDEATTGDVRLGGISCKGMKANELAQLRNQSIGFIFQFHYLLPEFTALENVLMPYRMWHSKIDHKTKERAQELLTLVGLESRMNYQVNMLSGGQQQRVAIARALMNNPKVILADEPTGNLDSEGTESIYELLRDINQTLQTTFIIITHDQRIAQKADRIIEVKDGRIVLDVTKDSK